MDGQWGDPYGAGDPRHFDHGDPAVDEVWRQRLSRPTPDATLVAVNDLVPDIDSILMAAELEHAGRPDLAVFRRVEAAY